MDPSLTRKQQRQALRARARAVEKPFVGFVLRSPSLVHHLRKGAVTHGVSLTTWCHAILLDFSGAIPGLTGKSAETIKAAVRGE